MQIFFVLLLVIVAIGLWAAIPVFSLIVGTGLAVWFLYMLVTNLD